MNPRTRAREVALQLLFQYDINPWVSVDAMEQFVRDRLGPVREDDFSLKLYHGVVKIRDEIDTRLSGIAENWRVSRMASVDRNILRMGAYEMLYMNGITPGPVVLDEAIELARRYGSEDSPAFVNGILDRLFRTGGK